MPKRAHLFLKAMLSTKTLKLLQNFYHISYLFCLWPFQWNKKLKHFEKISNHDWRTHIWIRNNIVVFLKIVFLGIQIHDQKWQSNHLALILFEGLYFISYLNGLIHNFILWRKRDLLPILFLRCRLFDRLTRSESTHTYIFKHHFDYFNLLKKH